METLATLAEAAAPPKPARLAVIGHPIAHSLSPRMQQPALDEAGVDARYIALEVGPGEVARAFARMRELGFIGCNVTVPHKFDALDACDEIDDIARDLGAVNTVRFDPDATRGTNTDGIGFERAVEESLGLGLGGQSVMIIGAGGGAGAAIAAHCARAGVSRLVLANRTVAKAGALADQLRARHPQLDLATSGTTVPVAELGELAAGCRLLVNTTSLGLRPNDPSPIPPDCLRADHHVFDSVYHRTALIAAAEQAGARSANGRLMLLHQGVAAFQFWFPGSTPEKAMRRGLAG